MAPNLDTDLESNSELSQLEQIEETLRKLQRDTLKIKRRNDDIIRTFDRRRTVTVYGNEHRAGSTQCGGERSDAVKLTNETPGLPIKPPRRNSKPVLLLPEVEQALKESAEVRKQMQDTLKSCPEDRERHRRCLNEMKNENQKVILPSTSNNISNLNLSSNSNRAIVSPLTLEELELLYICKLYENPNGTCQINPAFAVLNGIKAGFKDVLQKLSYSDSNSKPMQRDIQTGVANRRTDEHFILTNPKGNQREVPSTTLLEEVRHSKPQPKPRRISTVVNSTENINNIVPSRPSSSKVISRPRAPPPPPPKEKVTYEELTKMYQEDQNVTTEDDSTMPRCPVPKPRTKGPTTSNPVQIQQDFNTESELDESTSEFEFVLAPLVVKTVQCSEDSDESLLMINNKKEQSQPAISENLSKGFSKFRKPLYVPKPYKKPKYQDSKKSCIKDLIVSPLIPEAKKKSRPPSPPPKKFTRTPSLPTVTLHNLSEEEATISYNSVSCSNFLSIPTFPNSVTPPPTMSTGKPSGRIECLISGKPLNSSNIHLHPSLPSDSGLPPRISALCSGVPISSINIPVTPWVTNERQQSKICFIEKWQKDHTPSYEEPCISKTDEQLIIQESIDETFAFLDEDKCTFTSNPTVSYCLAQDSPPIDIKSGDEPQNNFVKNDSQTAISTSEKILFENSAEVWNLSVDIINEATAEVTTNNSCLYVQEVSLVSEWEIQEEHSKAPIKIQEKMLFENYAEVWNSSVDIINESKAEVTTNNSCLNVQEVPLESDWKTQEEPSTPVSDIPIKVQLTESNEANLSQPPPLPTVGPPPPPPTMPAMPIYEESYNSTYKKLASLPITPLNMKLCQATVFDNMWKCGDDKLNIDMKFIEDNFSNGETSDSESPKNLRLSIAVGTLPINKGTEILSHNRRQVVAIGTRKLKLPTDKIGSVLKRLDFEKLSTDDIQILIQIVPKETEQSMFKTLDGSKFETLCKEDQIMKSLSEIPRVAVKLEAINYILTFDETVKSFESEIKLLETASRSLKNSKKFPKMLEIVLLVINKAFIKDSDPVQGFEIQSLHRLANKKSSDGKVSLLHCIAKCLQTTVPEAVKFYEDFVNIEEASKVSIKDFQELLDEAENGLEKIREEIHVIQNKENFEGTNTVDSVFKTAKFVVDAAEKLTDIKKRWDVTLKSLYKVMEYYGVSPNHKMDTKDFFTMILNFVKDYKKALSQSDHALQPSGPNKNGETSSVEQVDRQISPGSNLKGHMERRESISKLPVGPHSRKSLGNNNTSTVRDEISRDSGQPTEFIDAVLVLGDGQGQAESRLRRRASFYTPRPYTRRSLGPIKTQDFNRER